MSARQDLLVVDGQLKDLETKVEALHEEEYPLYLKRHETVQRLLDEEKPLRGTEWTLKFNYDGHLFLEFDGHRFDDNMKEVHELCSTSWHADFKLEEGVSLDFNDTIVSLRFEDPSKIADAAKRHGLKVSSSNLEERAEMLRRELAGLALVSAQLGLNLP